ncbi:MAG: blaR1 peptidase M56 family protein [Flavobacteriaceae bacterium]|nr:blaR1 peptidase M56 family protein [Flavobacteriaceae bacterium]
MIHYILQVLLFQLLFLAVYDVFLKKETFFNYNRLYLLGTSVVSFVIPFLKIEAIQQSIPQEYRVQLPAVLLGNATETTTNSSVLLDEVVLTQQSISWTTILLGIYLLGLVISILLFSLKLRKLYLLKKSAVLQKKNGYGLAILQESDVAFTFLNTIYLGARLSAAQKHHILQHELVHVQQRHTWDLLFFELLRILVWFNPLVYVFQQKIQALHEYTADRLVASKDKAGYYQNLLSEVFGTTKISFINTFYKSSITRLNVFGHSIKFRGEDGQVKNRIVMLQKSNSKKIVQLKYLLLIPAVCAMLFYTSCSEETRNEESDLLTKIGNLQTDISSKGQLSEDEFKALVKLVAENRKDVVFQKKEDGYNEYQTEDLSSVPFAVIEKVPTYPNCSGTNEEMRICMSKQIQQFVGENFNTKLANTLNLSGRQRISVQFKIDQTGNVVDVRARAPHPDLEVEAVRVVSNLPQMLPGEQDGKKVSVIYALPILFEVNE